MRNGICALLVALGTACAATEPPRVEPPAVVRVAAVQCSSRMGEPEANRAKLGALVREAASKGARIVVLPEAAITGYLSQDLRTNWHVPGRPLESSFRGWDPANVAETVPGPSTRFFAALSEELRIYVTVPLVEKEGDAYFNTVCLAAPDGRIVAHYRKLTPWPWPEKSWATPGNRGIQTFDTEYGRVGLAICFDIHTILGRYDSRELWALLYPIAWVSDGPPAAWFRQRLPARVRAHGIYLVGANWSVDEEQDWSGYGYSTIIGPGGKVLAQAESRTGSEIVYSDLPSGASASSASAGSSAGSSGG